jgi:polyferredoxin
VHVRVAPGSRGIDVLQWPVIGTFLRWRHARTAFQAVLLIVALLVVVDGLAASHLDPTDFATTITWVHYRGLLVVALLAAGNLFCAGCPFVLVRDAGRRLVSPTFAFPRWLRTKWVAIALFAALLFCYELFDLWALPRATAWLVLTYFVAAFVVDLIFTGATFCKYLCPIGQFNFVASTCSPLELRIKQADTCHTCRTVDCIKGTRAPGSPDVVLQRGCELRLFLPLKTGNLDCTLCLDCVHACPHDNIALATRLPGAELANARRRSGIGRLGRRWDIAALVAVFTFGSLMNAIGMIAPVHGVEAWISQAFGFVSEAPALGVLFGAVVIAAPLALIGGGAALTRLLTGDRNRRMLQVGVNYAYALAPFGFGMWLAHYGFHLLTGALTIVPVTQRAALDLLSWPALGQPLWNLTGMRPGSVFPIQAGLVLLGTMGSLATAYQISERDYPGRAAAALAPWLAVIVSLAAVAVWILLQPMEMRGTGLLG